ncbi:MAG: hypothetical protein D6757_05370, partial [Alphaproteobacteria bacterium]
MPAAAAGAADRRAGTDEDTGDKADERDAIRMRSRNGASPARRLALNGRARDKKETKPHTRPDGRDHAIHDLLQEPIELMPSFPPSHSHDRDLPTEAGEAPPERVEDGSRDTLPLEILLGDEDPSPAAGTALLDGGKKRTEAHKIIAIALAGISVVLVVLSLGLMIGKLLPALGIAGAMAGIAGIWIGTRMLAAGRAPADGNEARDDADDRPSRERTPTDSSLPRQ